MKSRVMANAADFEGGQGITPAFVRGQPGIEIRVGYPIGSQHTLNGCA
jgi:hypothetical protein